MRRPGRVNITIATRRSNGLTHLRIREDIPEVVVVHNAHSVRIKGVGDGKRYLRFCLDECDGHFFNERFVLLLLCFRPGSPLLRFRLSDF